MGKKSGPTPPPAPDPTVVSKAQSDANIASATAQQKLNMVNTYGPNGSVVYSADPNAPGGYSQTTNLSPDQQSLYNLQNQTELGATQIGYDQLGRVRQALAAPLDTNGLPQLQGGVDLSGLHPGQGVQSGFNTGQPLQYGFNPGQAVQGHVGGDLNQARQQAQDAAYAAATSRLDPQFQRQQSSMETRLANQGLSVNSDAYKNSEDTFNRGKNDAYSQAQQYAVGQGNTAADQLFQQQMGQGTFANQAAGQEYQQNLGQAGFYNQTAGQDYSQNLGAAQFANQAQQQAFGQQATSAGLGQQNASLNNTARQQGLQERAYIQNQPINQLTGLLGLGQVSMPNGVQYTPSQVGQTDVTGAYALNTQANNANYQAQMQRQSGVMGGLMSLGSAAIMASDRRLKRDVRLIRRRRDGVGVYAFRYRAGGPERIGVMAQELAKVRPDLVVRRQDGFLAVNYAGLGAL